MDIAGGSQGGAGTVILGHALAPLDGSERAEAVLGWLRFLPLQRLTLLNVCEPGQESIGRAQQYLADITGRIEAPGRAVDTLVVEGCPAESIVTAAAGVDLVIMSTRGAGGGGRLVFGSVADRVARHAPAPTLLVRGGRAPVSAEALHRVVVPLDGSAAAERALPMAAALAQTLSCSVHLVTVQESSDQNDAGSAASPTPYLLAHARDMQDQGVEATVELRSGDPGRTLLERVQPGDLLVLTTHGQGAARRWQIGGVAEKLLRQASAPVVLVRADTP